MEINDIVEAIRAHRVRITDHADEEAQSDCLTLDGVFFSAMQGEIIEHYQSDKPYPSCLILGRTQGGVVVHSVWAYNEDNGWAVLITVYRPDAGRWTDWRERKNP